MLPVQCCAGSKRLPVPLKSRLTQKKVPGKGWEFMVYNPIDQVILTQDANQRSATTQVMSMVKYDGQGRVIYKFVSPVTQEIWEREFLPRIAAARRGGA